MSSSASTTQPATALPAATTSLTQSIEKLDGSMAAGKSNYQAWKFRIVRILKEKGLLTAIEEEVDKNNSKEVARDNAAFTILTLNVKDSQITHIQECSTAKEAWDDLQVVHQGIGASGCMVLMQRLWVLRMIEGEDMAEHLNKFRELANQVESLSTLGKGMDNNELVTLFSLSHPESYKPIIMVLQSWAEEVSFDTFAGGLLQDFARRQVAGKGYQGGQQSSPAAAFTVRVPTLGRGGGRYGAGRGGMRALHTSSFGPSENAVGFNKSAGKPKGKGKCFYCQKDGHWKRDCYQKKSDDLKEANQQSRGEQSGLAFTIAESTSTTQGRLDWIIDSGASQHLCYRKEMFLCGTYKAIPHRGIEIADGSLIEAIGMGDIGIGSRVLSGVLIVP